MKDGREEWYEATRKVSVTRVDVTTAAQSLARGHLAGPTSAYFLTKALAAAALFGAEMSETDETVVLQMKCRGPLGGLNVECTAAGTLRGYTERKVLDDFDGLGVPDEAKVIGERHWQITRSVPGRLLSQGLATSLDGYLTDSLQRRARLFLEAAVSDEVEILAASGWLVEALPDSSEDLSTWNFSRLSRASRAVLSDWGLAGAELKRTTPLKFACTCSPERAQAMLAALREEERATLPSKVDITCHMCGRTFSIPTRT